MLRVAVIGGGLFGCSAALALADDGHDVVLYESHDDIMQEASLNNHSRLHHGFHYPRSEATIEQCLAGYISFMSWYSNAVSSSHAKYYAIAAEDSLTSVEEFEAVCDKYNLALEAEWPSMAVLNREKIAKCWKVSEPLFDANILRHLVWEKLRKNQKINFKLDWTVRNIQRMDQIYLIDGQAYDAVVNATYSSLEQFDSILGIKTDNYIKERVIIPMVQASLMKIGVTVMDGPFGGIMPAGATSDLLLYHVVKSRTQGCSTAQEHSKEILAALVEWFPFLESSTIVGWYETIRAIAGRGDDTRETVVQEHLPNYFHIFSAKIGTCVDAAHDLVSRLQHR